MRASRQIWLVARREVRERSRSPAFRAGLALMLIVVVAAIVLPAVTGSGSGTKGVAIVGAAPATLPDAIVEQGDALGTRIEVQRYEDAAAAEQAVRDGDVDVALVEGRRLEWQDEPDERLRAAVAGAIQLVALQERAEAAGIDPEALLALVAPVPVDDVELGLVAERSPDDELAAYVMSVLLLMAIATYGNLVLTGVVEEKANRVVEVLLARMPARNLLAGKVAGIGLLGFGQVLLTAVAALVASLVVDSVDLPAVRMSVLVWVVVWFILGYAVFATAYGALGSLASRTEDASSAAGPVTMILIVGYWAAYVAVAEDPEGGWSQLASFVPITAPFAMPGRIALGTAAAWEPVAAVGLTLLAIVGLVLFAGRVYSGAVLHSGAAIKLREAWRRAPVTEASTGVPATPHRPA